MGARGFDAALRLYGAFSGRRVAVIGGGALADDALRAAREAGEGDEPGGAGVGEAEQGMRLGTAGRAAREAAPGRGRRGHLHAVLHRLEQCGARGDDALFHARRVARRGVEPTAEEIGHVHAEQAGIERMLVDEERALARGSGGARGRDAGCSGADADGVVAPARRGDLAGARG
ncbi:MAG: hypothetical protein ACKOUS_14530, partial [Alphaproteobacteria bacterium]